MSDTASVNDISHHTATTSELSLPAQSDSSNNNKKQVPAGYTVHREASAEVLLAEGRDVFINPIQEFNRDLSTLAIRTWSELANEQKRAKWERKKQNAALNQNKGKKRKHEEEDAVTEPAETTDATSEVVSSQSLLFHIWLTSCSRLPHEPLTSKTRDHTLRTRLLSSKVFLPPGFGQYAMPRRFQP